MVIFEIMRCS